MKTNLPPYFKPNDLQSALKFLTPEVTILSGGTDFYPSRVGQAIQEKILDISAIQELKEIVETPEHWKIGAAASWSDLLRHPLPSYFDALKLAAREVGGVQIQNKGTLAGNLCNASPAADGSPVLLTLDAQIEVQSAQKRQLLPLSEFLLGSRQIQLPPDALVSAILIPKRKNRTESHFLKLGARHYLVISIVMVSAVIEEQAGQIVSAAISVGSCSPVAQRLPKLEERLKGFPVKSPWGEQVRFDDLEQLSPIADIRASADYRKEAAFVLLKRTLQAVQMKFNPT